MSGVIIEQPELSRTGWALGHPLLTQYYDSEWGLPVYDETGVFEQLSLEIFQAGLSWLTVLRKREAFRAVFDGFDTERVAHYTAADVERVIASDGIVRNRRKIEAVVAGAQAAMKLRSEGPDLASLVWSYMPEISPAPSIDEEVPRSSRESARLAKDLKQRGFLFVGPTNMFALMAAIGIVDAHVLTSHRRGCSGLWNKDGTRSTAATSG